MFELTTFVQLLIATTVVNLIAFVVSWRRRKSTGGLYFTAGLAAAATWTLAAAFDYASVPLEQKVFFAKVEYAASYTALTLFAFFALSYAGHDEWLEARGRRILFALPGIVCTLLAWTNDLHGWLWASFTPGEIGRNTVVFEHGPGYAVALISGYGLFVVILSNLWQVSRHGAEVTRRQARLLVAASLVPLAGNLAYLLQGPEMRGLDWSPISFSASGVLLLVALYGTGFLDLAPIARDQLVRSLPDGMIVLDPQSRIMELNESAARMISKPGAETRVIGRPLAEVAPEATALLSADAAEETRVELTLGDDEPQTVDALASPLSRHRGKPVGRLIVLRNIDQRKQTEEALRLANERLARQLEEIEALQGSLQEQAIRDPLTRLHNRRFFDEVIDRELMRGARLAHSVSLVSIDLDRFKRINDVYGHAAGDACLVRFAELLRSHVRGSDIACRYGGEEFLLVLGDTELTGALLMANSLRQRLAESSIEVGGQLIEMTLSAGVTTYPIHGVEVAELLERADRALYRAKGDGRNRVVAWSDELV